MILINIRSVVKDCSASVAYATFNGCTGTTRYATAETTGPVICNQDVKNTQITAFLNKDSAAAPVFSITSPVVGDVDLAAGGGVNRRLGIRADTESAALAVVSVIAGNDAASHTEEVGISTIACKNSASRIL